MEPAVNQPPNQPASPHVPEPVTSSPSKRRKLTYVYWFIFFSILVVSFLYWMFVLRFIEYTNDAYVEGNQIFLTPLKSGFVTAIHTDDTFLVKKGQLLIELDTTDAQIALEQAKKEMAKAVREVCQAFHQVFVYQSEIETKKAEFIKAAQDYKHRQDVISAFGVSGEDFEHAIAAFRASYFSLKNSGALFDRALAFVQGTSIRNHPSILWAANQVRFTWVQHYRCKIYSPAEGLVAQRTIQVGMWVNAGQPLLSVIPLDQIWVNANFKETQLKSMRIGQNVTITSDLYGRDVIFHGKIVGLPGGAGNAFSLLPPQNLSGNWIKIVQRLPVRVALNPEELIEHPLRVGLSMEATADIADLSGRLVPETIDGSPSYQTSIFELEERGNQELIEAIMKENMDPTLNEYLDSPLDPFWGSMHLEAEIQNYLKQMEISLHDVLKHSYH
jgi:membrane fusion protein (multidrug efflux system)